MSIESLLRMANDIADFFAAEPDRALAIDGIATHIRRYWEPRMRRQIIAYVESGGQGLGELALAAIRQLADAEHAATDR